MPASQLVAVAPSATGPTAPTPLSKAASESSSAAQTYILTLQADETLPIIAVSAQAPDAEQAARLANAASTGLRDYLRSVAGAQNVPAARQVVISSLGAAQSADVVKGPRRLIAIVAFVFIFGLACFGVIMISGLARGWRRAAALERSGGEDAPTPRDGGSQPVGRAVPAPALVARANAHGRRALRRGRRAPRGLTPARPFRCDRPPCGRSLRRSALV